MNEENTHPEIWIEPDMDDMVDAFYFSDDAQGDSLIDALKEVESGLQVPRFLQKTVVAQLAEAEQATLSFSNLVLVGYSTGALLAMLHYQKRPGRFSALLLLSPTLDLKQAQAIHTLPENMVVIYSKRDQDALAALNKFQDKPGFKWVGVDDDSTLSNSLTTIQKEFKTLIHTLPYRNASL